MKTIILTAAAVIALVSTVSAETAPMLDVIDIQVKHFSELEAQVNKYCKLYKREQVKYANFQSNQSAYGTLDEVILGGAKQQARQEMWGATYSASNDQAKASVPRGFEPMTCTGTFPEVGGSLSINWGKMTSAEWLRGDITSTFTFAPNKLKYPISVRDSRGNSQLVGTRQAADKPFIVSSVDLPFLKFDGLSNTWNVGAGKYNLGRNSLIDFFNTAESDCRFWGEFKSGRRCLNVQEIFKSLDDVALQNNFTTQFTSYMYQISRHAAWQDLRDLAITEYTAGQLERATATIRRALEHAKITVQVEDHWQSALDYERSMRDLAQMYLEGKQYAKAGDSYDQLTAYVSKLPAHRDFKNYYNGAAITYRQLGRESDAQRMDANAAACPN